MAGALGVSIAVALRASRAVEITGDAAALTGIGRAQMQNFGILAPDRPSARPICRPCLDRSERRPHLMGVLGATICAHALDQVRRRTGTHALEITPARGVEAAAG